MGADLVGWIAKGPLKLRVSRKHKRQIVQQLTQIADWWRSLGEDAEGDYASHVDECPIPLDQSLIEDEQSFYRLIEWLTGYELLTGYPDVPDVAPREFIADRLDELLIWPPDDRGSVSIQDPDDPKQVIVFSGEMTWGDEPDLDGYRQLQLLALTGVGALVGIKLLAPCITLTLKD